MYAHVDIRNFYAACEQYLNPEYRGKPLVVYNESSFGKQKIIAVSKEAKRKGLSRDSSVDYAKSLGAILVKSNLEEYRKIASQLVKICSEHTGLNVSHPHVDDIVMEVPDLKKAMNLSRKVEKVYNEMGFEAAIGISFNQDYADIATRIAKNYGLTYIGKKAAKRLIYPQPVSQFPNIGPKRQEQLNKMGIFTIGDIASMPLYIIQAALGNEIGKKIYYSVKGIDINEGQMGMFP